MRRRRLALLALFVVPTVAGWLAWGGRNQKAHAATEAATANDVQTNNDERFSAAEYRYRTSQANHWRAFMLKR
jgi:hypothetical protein